VVYVSDGTGRYSEVAQLQVIRTMFVMNVMSSRMVIISIIFDINVGNGHWMLVLVIRNIDD
jgi:hypothetical protein